MIIATQMIPITNRGDWLTLRQQDITASDVAALFGLSKFTSALALYAEKTGTGKPRGDTPAMRAGRIMEAAIAAAVQEEKPDWQIEKATKFYRDPAARIGCTPDYVRLVPNTNGMLDKWPIECKFVQPKIFEEDWRDGPPLMYVLQTLVQVYLLNAPQGYIAVMLDNRAKDVFIYDVPRNDEAWSKIVARVAKFWQDVKDGKLPDADYAQDGETLKALYPADPTKAPLDLTGDVYFVNLLTQRQTYADAARDAKQAIEEIDAEIIDLMQGAPEARVDGFRITYKAQTRAAYTVPANTFSVLRVTKTKEEKVL